MPRCPSHPDVELEAKKKGWYCEECERNVLDFEQWPRQPTTEVHCPALALKSLPCLIAIPAQEYVTESNPVLRLWSACDTIEILLRLMVAVGIADVLRASNGGLPDLLRTELSSRIAQPTLGKWRGMAAAVAHHLPHDSLVPELPGYLCGTLEPLLDGERDNPTVENSLSLLRNKLAHGAGMTRVVAARLMQLHGPRFEAALSAAAWLTDVMLVAPRNVFDACVLTGPAGKPEPLPELDAAVMSKVGEQQSSNAVLAVRSKMALSIWPLVSYGVPTGLDRTLGPASVAVPQVYVRSDVVQLLLTPLGSEEVAQGTAAPDALSAFKDLFECNADVEPCEVAGFENDMRTDAIQRVGRDAEVAAMHAALEAMQHGVLWVTGPAGIGKSFAVAQLAVDLMDRVDERTLILPYRFRSGDERCSRTKFLVFALERLRPWLNGSSRAPVTHKKPEEELRWLLSQAQPHRVVFVLDGLDEIAALDARFADEIPLSLHAEGIVWVCAGRPEPRLVQAFSPDRCTAVFPNGLPPLDEGGVRAMVLAKLGPLRKRLVARDRDDKDRVVNPFLTRVVANAQGLPIYVKYVIGDVLAGRLRAFEEQLPPSLGAYHEELLKRCAIGSLQLMLTPIACSLAVAHEPLSVETLHAIMVVWLRIPAATEGRRRITEALAALAHMLRRVAVPGGPDCYCLFHHSLREHIVRSPTTSETVSDARRVFADAAQRWTEPAMAEFLPYSFRHGIRHLIEVGEHATAIGLLTSLPYLQARLLSLGPASIEDIEADFELAASPNASAPAEWRSFLSSNAHLIRRGGGAMLLQAALSEPSDSLVCRRACEMVVLRSVRPHLVRVRFTSHPANATVERRFDLDAGVTALIQHPDGNRLLVGTRDGSLFVLELPTGSIQKVRNPRDASAPTKTSLPHGMPQTLPNLPNTVAGLYLRDDGHSVVVEYRKDEPRLWQLDTGTLIEPAACRGAWTAKDSRIHPRGVWVANSTPAGVELKDLDSGSTVASFLCPGARASFGRPSFNRAGDYVAAMSGDGTAAVWRLATGELVRRIETRSQEHNQADERASDIALLGGGGESMLTANDLWFDFRAGQNPIAIEPQGKSAFLVPRGLALSSDEKVLYLGLDSVVELWDLASGTRVGQLEGHSGSAPTLGMYGGVPALTVSTSGRQLFSGGLDRAVLCWRLCDDASGPGWARHGSSIRAIAAVGAETLLTGSQDGELGFWCPEPSARMRSTRVEGGAVRCVATLPDGLLVAGGNDGRVSYCTREMQLDRTLELHEGAIRCLVVGGDGSVASAGDDGIVCISRQSAAGAASLSGHNGRVNALQFHGRKRLISGGEDGRICVWDVPQKLVYEVLQLGAPVQGIASIPTTDRVVAVTADGGLHVCNWSTGEREVSVKGTPTSPRALAISQKHKVVVTGEGNALGVWRLPTLEQQHMFEGHADQVSAAVILGEDLVASAGFDGQVIVWSLQTGQRIASWCCEAAVTVLTAVGAGALGAGDSSGEVYLLRLCGSAR